MKFFGGSASAIPGPVALLLGLAVGFLFILIWRAITMSLPSSKPAPELVAVSKHFFAENSGGNIHPWCVYSLASVAKYISGEASDVNDFACSSRADAVALMAALDLIADAAKGGAA